MSKIKKIIFYLFHPNELIIRQELKRFEKKSRSYSDEEFIKKRYKIRFRKDINLDNPISFNEKLNWLKLNFRDEKLSKMVDKYESKRIVQSILGGNYVAKCFGVWDTFDEIDFDSLPNSFVLKTTHDCGGVYIVKNKMLFDKEKAKKFISKHLENNYYLHCREWPYKNVPPRVLAEEFIDNGSSDVLPVYKFFCFNGVPKIVQVITNDKKPNESIDYFDIDWNLLHLRQNFPNSKIPPLKPSMLDEMLEICRKLSVGYPFIRIDLYALEKGIKFSEFTFFSDAGFAKFHPSTRDKQLGDLIDLTII